MSETTAFEDLELLDGGDLKAVFDYMPAETVVAALWGCPMALRGRLLRKLSKMDSTRIEKAIAAMTHLTFEQVRNGQQEAVAVMCQMSRAGQIAFDAPEDMVA
jgi:flagellar motor switch protein FliG